VIGIEDGEVVVTLAAGEYGISPGQACVFYADESETSEVLGGGFISEAQPSGWTGLSLRAGRERAAHGSTGSP
jgi:tRNA-specific 2-thiouridylase